MTWEYALYIAIGVVVGFILGALAVRFGNPKVREQNKIAFELKKSQAELEDYRKELTSHFAHSAELLDKMAKDYRQLYEHMASSSSALLPDLPGAHNPFSYKLADKLAESEADNDQIPVEIPRDYSVKPSGLLKSDSSVTTKSE